jgi:hypothetical protein
VVAVFCHKVIGHFAALSLVIGGKGGLHGA